MLYTGFFKNNINKSRKVGYR